MCPQLFLLNQRLYDQEAPPGEAPRERLQEAQLLRNAKVRRAGGGPGTGRC